MDCTEFVTCFTDYLDGSLTPADERAMEEHLGRCGACLRYKNVVEHGRSLLRSLPAPELREDFGPRLEHRLYHVEEELALDDETASRAPALAVLGVAVLLTVVAWSPVLRGGAPVVQLEPIVVDRAPVPVRPVPASFTNARQTLPERVRDLDAPIWDDMLLYEYSPLSRRYQEGARARQVGLETGR